MYISLFKVSKICWAITLPNGDKAHAFDTIELAADFLESIGVKDEEIDDALVDMATQGTTRASFGTDGKFTGSDHEKLNGLFGNA